MSNVTLPATFADVLDLVHRSDVVSWSRDEKRLNLTIDDLEADRRAVVDVSFQRLTVDARMLSGFDAKANRWSEYVGAPTHGQLANRRGEKALLVWITAKATEVCRCPNPGYFTFYRRKVNGRA